MRGLRRLRMGTAAMIGVVALVAGCQAIEDERTADKEKLLRQAGFQVRPATTPEQTAHLNALPQRTFVTYRRDGTVHYVFADAKGCGCIYVGTPDEHARYRTLEDQEIARSSDRLNAAIDRADAQQYWAAWQGDMSQPEDIPPAAMEQPGHMQPIE